MSTRNAPSMTAKSSFFTQRSALVNDIAAALENVLQNINKLNRSLEGVIAVGNEFGNVEALWSQFEGVMAQPEDEEKKDGEEDEQDEEEEDGDEDEGEEQGEEGKRSSSRGT